MPQADAELVVVQEVEAGEEREAGLLHQAGTAAEGAAQHQAALAAAQQVRGQAVKCSSALNCCLKSDLASPVPDLSNEEIY